MHVCAHAHAADLNRIIESTQNFSFIVPAMLVYIL